ncbi:MAG: malate dehydrogenase [Candidatus Omnitrophica bacterium]|nr:malate dehydrogenase [Candidatus Omnitrophota bacterium]MDD5519115.1 malate dehydrogenase [Candidatus Omnitrophota bacterium]
MKISIIGAGNVGALSAMRIAQYNLGDIFLVDIAKGLARGKSLDLADAQAVLGFDYNIQGSDDISSIKDSDIVVITAGLARKPGMTREELLAKNSQILKDVCVNIKELASQAIVMVVTNPLDLMTYLALKTTGFARNKVLGMGSSLDSSRLANLIARELKLPATSVETMVIGAHGEGMLPLARHTKIKGVSLEEFLSDEKMEGLTKGTIGRGAEIVALLGSGSAFFAPSAAVAQMVKIIAKDEKKIIGACAYLDGEYGIKDICIGVPCRLGRAGIEKIIELDLTDKEKKELMHSADSIRNLLKQLPV